MRWWAEGGGQKRWRGGPGGLPFVFSPFWVPLGGPPPASSSSWGPLRGGSPPYGDADRDLGPPGGAPSGSSRGASRGLASLWGSPFSGSGLPSPWGGPLGGVSGGHGVLAEGGRPPRGTPTAPGGTSASPRGTPTAPRGTSASPTGPAPPPTGPAAPPTGPHPPPTAPAAPPTAPAAPVGGLRRGVPPRVRPLPASLQLLDEQGFTYVVGVQRASSTSRRSARADHQQPDVRVVTPLAFVAEHGKI